MSASRPEDAITQPHSYSLYFDFKAWTFNITKTKAARWAMSVTQGAAYGLVVDTVLDVIFPDQVFFNVVRYASTAVTFAITTRYTSHVISSHLEKEEQRDLRMEIMALEISQLKAQFNLNVDLTNKNNIEFETAYCQDRTPRGNIEKIEEVSFKTPAIAAKEKQLAETYRLSQENGESFLRLRRRLGGFFNRNHPEHLPLITDLHISENGETCYQSTGHRQHEKFETPDQNNDTTISINDISGTDHLVPSANVSPYRFFVKGVKSGCPRVSEFPGDELKLDGSSPPRTP